MFCCNYIEELCCHNACHIQDKINKFCKSLDFDRPYGAFWVLKMIEKCLQLFISNRFFIGFLLTVYQFYSFIQIMQKDAKNNIRISDFLIS